MDYGSICAGCENLEDRRSTAFDRGADSLRGHSVCASICFESVNSRGVCTNRATLPAEFHRCRHTFGPHWVEYRLLRRFFPQRGTLGAGYLWLQCSRSFPIASSPRDGHAREIFSSNSVLICGDTGVARGNLSGPTVRAKTFSAATTIARSQFTCDNRPTLSCPLELGCLSAGEI